MSIVDKFCDMTGYEKYYTLNPSLYLEYGFKKSDEEYSPYIVACRDNVPTKFNIINKNLQEMFNLEYGLENLHIKIDYFDPYK